MGGMVWRLRTAVWMLVALTLTCLATVRWFLSPTSNDRLFSLTPATILGPEEDSKQIHIGKEMAWRRAVLEKVCMEKGMGSASKDLLTQQLLNNPKMLNNMLVDDKHKVLYCYVPKVACTNWKRMLLQLTGQTNYTNPLSIPSDSVHRKNVFVKLSDLQSHDILMRLSTYTKFLFVRHPVERVLSAFRNKFEKNYTSSAYFKKRFGVKIMKKYRVGLDPSLVPQTGHGVKFSEFISYLIDTRTDQFNEHWALMSSMCHPCSVRYDYIGKYETLAEDSEHILRQVGAHPKLHFPNIVPSKTTAFVEPYFDTLSSQQQRDLIRIYEDDFLLFDYHFRNFL